MGAVIVNSFGSGVSEVSRRLSLSVGEVLRLKRSIREIYVISGCAWVSYAGRDILLNAGDRTAFTSNQDVPVISAVGTSPLLFDASR
jgi:hypothetical protein